MTAEARKSIEQAKQVTLVCSFEVVMQAFAAGGFLGGCQVGYAG